MASRGSSALDELTSGDVAGDLLVVPLGATEQHGPHLPLGRSVGMGRHAGRAMRTPVESRRQ
jgi:hypothetical protein